MVITGCYASLGQHKKAQELLDAIPALIEKRKVAAAKYLPTEVFIQKHLVFYKEKQQRRKGPEAKYAECIKISLAEGVEYLSCFSFHLMISLCRNGYMSVH